MGLRIIFNFFEHFIYHSNYSIMTLKKKTSLAVSFFVMLVALAVMIGWLTRVDALIRILPGFESMKWNTALAFLLAGGAFATLQAENQKVWGIPQKILSLLTFGLGLAVMMQYITGNDYGIDEFFVEDYGARIDHGPYPGRMSFSTALCFSLIGISFILIRARQYVFQFIGQFFFHLITAITLVAILGYAYDIPSLHKLSFIVSMALHTAVAFFLLSAIASFYNYNMGLGGLFLGKRVGNVMARRLFPYLAVSLVFMGYVGIWSLRLDWFGAQFGVAIFVITFLFIGLFLIWMTAKSLNMIDKQRQKAEESIHALNRKLELKVKSRTTALEEVSNRLKQATSATRIGIWEYKGDENILKLDDTTKVLHGFEEADSEMSIHDFLQSVCSEDREEVSSIINGAISENDKLDINYRVSHPDTGLRYLRSRAAVRRGTGNSSIQFIGTVWDVTDEKLAELELTKSNERNKIFVAQAPNALAMFDKDMRYMAASKKWIDDYGLEGRDIIGKSHYEVFPEIGEDWKKTHQECLAGSIDKCDEGKFERENGTVQYLKWEVRPWYLSEDEIGGLLMYTEDITHYKEREIAQRRTEQILATTSEAARIGTWEVNLINQEVTWSPVTREIHGVDMDYIPDLTTGINFYREGESRDTITRLVNKSIEDGKTYDVELQIVTAQGEPKWVRVIGQAELDNGKCERLYGVFQDIDAKRRTQQELQSVNRELKAILDSSTHVSIISTDLEGVITHFNKGAETLLGYKQEELVNKSSAGVLHLREEVEARGDELTEKFGREIRGFDVFVEYARQGRFENRQWTYIRKDGTSFPIQLSVTAIWGTEGELTGFLGIATDISEIKEKEKKINQAKFELEALTGRLSGQNTQLANFAHITSHNLRSPVSNLLMLLNMYKDSAYDSVEKEVLFGKFEGVIHHLSDTLNDLMQALQIQEDVNKEREWVSFESVFNKTVSMLEGDIINSEASIKADFSQAEKVHYNKGYLESIFLNLLSNTLKYRSPDRLPEILVTTKVENGSTVLSVKDNGLGINLKRHGAKLFGLHKTFHRHSEAKGVGLYLTKTQVETMGGEITATSEVNKGTEFTVNFNKAV